MTMEYVGKKKYKLELTPAQILWLERILGRTSDGCFKGNPRERKLCDNIHDKILEELEAEFN